VTTPRSIATVPTRRAVHAGCLFLAVATLGACSPPSAEPHEQSILEWLARTRAEFMVVHANRLPDKDLSQMHGMSHERVQVVLGPPGYVCTTGSTAFACQNGMDWIYPFHAACAPAPCVGGGVELWLKLDSSGNIAKAAWGVTE
jgi:hypothetical protein